MENTTHHFTSNFSFLEKEFSILANICTSAEYHLYSDPVVTLMKLRQFGERLTEILFNEHGLEFPYDDTQHNRLKTLDFEAYLPSRVKDLLFNIKNKGNVAAHDNKGSIDDAKIIIFSAFKVSKWLVETYAFNQSVDDVKFSMPPDLDSRHALSLLENDFKELEEKFNSLIAEREIKAIPKEKLKAIKQKSEKAASKIEMSEAETRNLIDDQLRAAGWEADTLKLNFKTKGTLPDRKRRIAIAEWKVGNKWADYALFIGHELYGIIEAKRYTLDISTNLRQSKIYSELAEEKDKVKLLGQWSNYKVPFLFSTNGRPYLEQIKTKSGIWFLDIRDESNQSRALMGFFTPDGLIKLHEQNIKETETKLKDEKYDFLSSKSGLGLRYYQIEAIRKVEEKIFTNKEDRRALLAMATGTGKTRTIVGLCYRLISSNRFNRILFLVDRTSLGIQAMGSFTDGKIKDINSFSEIYKIDGLKTMVPDIDTRVHFATVQGMVKRLFYQDNQEKIPAIDSYDCIIIDEAHRGYLLDKEIGEDDLSFKDQRDYVSKYRMVLEYFDAYSIGLTATPALHTTEIFGKAVYNYSYREAVIDGFLVDHDPPYIIKTKLNEEGIVWEKGSKPKVYDKEKNAIVEMDELEDELAIDISGFNKLVITDSFNRTVIKELIRYLDPDSDEKTLIFAATDNHADIIVRILIEEFKNLGIKIGEGAVQKITGNTYDPNELIKLFKNEKFPNIAVTVDLLTTGIDVPKICNIVFLRRVKSRILYEQMLGRATRKCDEIEKDAFQIFDAVRIYETLEEFTSMKPVVPNPKTSFVQLAQEMDVISSNDRAKKQLEQIAAKIQRKKKYIKAKDEENFWHLSSGKDADTLINDLLNGDEQESIEYVIKETNLWKFLDSIKRDRPYTYFSDHQDELCETERGYGSGKKPQDYLSSFKTFIEENRTKIEALNIVCTRPKELDRDSLKKLKLELDLAGFNSRTLNTAWKETKDVDITADIISYIRSLALGNSLISHEDRITTAVDKVRQIKSWTKIQIKWINRIEKQLLKESILKVSDLNDSPFKSDGGFNRLNKIFDNDLENLIDIINESLYTEIA